MHRAAAVALENIVVRVRRGFTSEYRPQCITKTLIDGDFLLLAGLVLIQADMIADRLTFHIVNIAPLQCENIAYTKSSIEPCYDQQVVAPVRLSILIIIPEFLKLVSVSYWFCCAHENTSFVKICTREMVALSCSDVLRSEKYLFHKKASWYDLLRSPCLHLLYRSGLSKLNPFFSLF